MEVKHGMTLKACSGAGGDIAVAVSVSEDCFWLAYPAPREDAVSGSIALLKQSLATNQTLWRTIASHSQPVEALALSSEDKPPLWLCSASQSSILLWNVDALCRGKL